MNADKFTFYIKNPAHLYQITYTELKSLVLRYPFCQNLRYLLLKKSILENHQESDRNLQLAATYSVDRNFLYKQIKEGDSYLSEADSFLLKEEYLELKELHPKSRSNETTDPTTEMKSGDQSTDNISKTPMKASEVIASLQPTDEKMPEAASFYDLEDIEEEELVDITNEMQGIFVLDAIEFPEIKTSTKYPGDELEITIGTNKEKNKKIKDEAISIEELIKLDSLSPLERWEKSKPPRKKKKKEKKEDRKTGMKKKNPDFEKIDALIEKTKKDVPLEITNKDIFDPDEDKAPKPSPKSSFSSWLKQFQSLEEKEQEKEETFVIPESKKEEPAPKKDKKKKKNPDKIKKTRITKDILQEKKEKESAKAPTAKIDKISEKAKKIAEKSLAINSEIVSETLAILLVKQENYKQAIKMYEKLSLIFPEKSGFFADQIKKLKNL